MGKLLIILFTPPTQFQNTDTVHELAKATVEKGHEVTVFCDIEATYNLLARQTLQGQTTAASKMAELIKKGVHVLLCRESARIRGIKTKEDLIEGVVESSLGHLAELMEQHDRVVAFGWPKERERTMVNNILLVIKSHPYEGGRSAEGFRMATAMIAMDLLPQMLFVDDGVYCLARNQAPDAQGAVSFAERLKTISDLVGVQVLSDSLVQRDLKPSDLDKSYNAKTLTLDEAANLLGQNDAVITF